MSEETLDELYERHVCFLETACEAILSDDSTDPIREHLLESNQPMTREEFKARFRELAKKPDKAERIKKLLRRPSEPTKGELDTWRRRLARILR